MPPQIRDVYKETSDDWSPSYGLTTVSHHYPTVETAGLKKLVRVSFFPLRPYTGRHATAESKIPKWRVCVWGADDMGMDFDTPDEAAAWEKFITVISWTDVTIHALKNEGFLPV